MNVVIPNWMKAIAGALLIMLLLVIVNRWYGQYKTMTTINASATATQTAPAKGEDKPAEEKKDDSKETADEKKDEAKESDAKTVIVLTDGLNFREDPSQDSNVIRGLDKDEKLVLIKEEGGWYQVRDSKDTEGWVSASPNYSKVQ